MTMVDANHKCVAAKMTPTSVTTSMEIRALANHALDSRSSLSVIRMGSPLLELMIVRADASKALRIRTHTRIHTWNGEKRADHSELT